VHYRLNQGKIISESGIPEAPRWLADGRLAFGYDEKGVTRLEYITPRPFPGNNIIFMRGVFDTLRCFLEKDGLNYTPDYRNTQILPFSIESDFEAAGQLFRLGVYALSESLVFTVGCPDDLPDGFRFKLNFYEGTLFVPADTGDFNHDSQGFERTRFPWAEEETCIMSGFHERHKTKPKEYSLHMCVGMNQAIAVTRSRYNGRISCSSLALQPGGLAVAAVTFATDAEQAKLKNLAVCGGFTARLDEQKKRYREVVLRAPVLTASTPELNDFFSLAPLYHESLKVPERAGAIRAKTTRYFVWGWDSIISNHATMLWRDPMHVRELLAFCEKTAHLDEGIFHAQAYDFTYDTFSPIISQGMYIALLQNYFDYTGDLETVKKHYGFAKTIFTRILQKKSADSGLFLGTSLFPDFPDCLNETGNDISLFNNSICYAALRSMEAVALLCGDCHSAALAREAFLSMESAFDNFFDKDLGFYVNSIDAATLEKRSTVNMTGFFFDSEICLELIQPHTEAMAKFLRTHAFTPCGIRSLPVWDAASDVDANQLHCTWPAVEEFVVQLMRVCGMDAQLRAWTNEVCFWTKRLLCPEGISTYIETDKPELDAWNCESGTWQGYSMRKWYGMIFRLVLGISFDAGGLTFSAPIEPFTLQNLIWRDKTFVVRSSGRGNCIAALTVNGRQYFGTQKPPIHAFTAAENTIDVLLSETAQPLFIERFTGGTVEELKSRGNTLTATLSGIGTCRLTVRSLYGFTVQIDEYNQSYPPGAATLDLRFEVGKPKTIKLAAQGS